MVTRLRMAKPAGWGFFSRDSFGEGDCYRSQPAKANRKNFFNSLFFPTDPRVRANSPACD